jgi:alkylation response protein AidB-like acyl-CoA dehydrogenase
MTDPDAPKRSRALSMLLIDLTTPGVTVRSLESIEGVSHLCETFFDDVQVPKENLVGERGRGWLAAMALVNIERSGTGFASLPQRILEELAYWRAPAMDYWFRWKMISALLLHFGNDEQKRTHLPCLPIERPGSKPRVKT